jgi:hypothetical protein
MQEGTQPPKAITKRGKKGYLARRRRCCWLDCFAGGAVVEAGGGVVAHGRRLQTATLLFQAAERERVFVFPSPLVFRFFLSVSFTSGRPLVLSVLFCFCF